MSENSTLRWTDACDSASRLTSATIDSCDSSSATSTSSVQESRYWIFLLTGNVVFGLGTAAIGPFSISYIDDAANPHNTPVYLGVLFTIAIFGPAAGLKSCVFKE